VPTLKKSSGSRRHRGGDFLAVLLLIAVVVGMGWLWWHQKHPKKVSHHQTAAAVHAAPVQTTTTIPPSSASAPARPSPPTITPPRSVETQAPPALAAAPAPGQEFPRPVHDALEAQVAMARRVISAGPVDGAIGSQTRAALAAFQRSENLFESRSLDTNTRTQLTLDAPVFTTYTVTTNDLARLQPLGKTWLAKSEQTALEYETILELVGEKFHAHVLLIKKLNPGVDWDHVAAGTVLKVPDIEYPDPDNKATFVVIHLSEKFLEAFDAETNLIAHFPCSIAARVEKRPVCELHVAVVAPHPNYTFNPELFPESPEAQQIGHKLVLPPGPNNPVGVAWVGLDKPGYGIHGTPVPEQVGRTESHGCFRLANWDAEYFMKLAWIGLPVEVVP
jgi:lipoprotein-anchoring transpeptidase ErfK/SrfK